MKSENVIWHIAGFARNLKYNDLPKEVVHEAKRRLIDSLGCAFGGMSDPAVKMVRASMKGKTTVRADGLAIGEKSFALESAAYLNTHAIRVLDWNDTYLSQEPAHPSDNIGAILANIGLETLDGKLIILAEALAYEIQCRMCDFASLRKCGWDHTYYLQLSSALASGKIIDLNLEQMKHAVSLALRHVPTRQTRAGRTISMSKGLAAAEAVEIGVKAARLAAHDITGPSEMFEGEYGLLKQILGDRTNFNIGVLDDLGKEFKILKIHTKFFPVEYHSQSAVLAAMGLRELMQISTKPDLENIERINIVSSEATKTIIGDESKKTPTTKESADHSIYYVVASTFLNGQMTSEQFSPKNLADTNIAKLISLMPDIEESSQYSRAYYDKICPEFPVMIIVKLKSGKVFISEVKIPKGHFANPLTDSELKTKFCIASNAVLAPETQSGLLDFLWDLENQSAYKIYWTLRELKIKKEEV